MSKLSKQERLDAAEAALYRLEGKEYLEAVEFVNDVQKYFSLRPEDALILAMEIAIASA